MSKAIRLSHSMEAKVFALSNPPSSETIGQVGEMRNGDLVTIAGLFESDGVTSVKFYVATDSGGNLVFRPVGT